ncbi:hypothetical protein ACIBCT_28255 [Streptosporangium sp. NPDC050855]|uniref:hypothetical protein n=1 Tax=Streptosporangium sp. NPDC050855 TaxID=3366194 RepID=UPI0037A6DBCC
MISGQEGPGQVGAAGNFDVGATERRFRDPNEEVLGGGTTAHRPEHAIRAWERAKLDR